jgi:carotenoid epsilon hydroxylase
VAEVSEFLFGTGFAIAGGDLWRVRRRAVGPALHKGYLDAMLTSVFGPAALRLNDKLAGAAVSGTPIDIEACFSQLTLDIIGAAVFNYEFDSLTQSSPVIQAVYTALKETESRATDVLPFWKFPWAHWFDPRQRKAKEAVALIRATTEELVGRCRAMVEAEEAGTDGNSLSDPSTPSADPSILRFLIASREEVSSTQLRDDLLSMLVAGHETTASVLTWTVYLLAQNPACMERAVAEVDEVLGSDPAPSSASQYASLRYLTRCVAESMRLYPHPPVLLRRARVGDSLPPGDWPVPAGQDVMISVYNIHHSPAVWGETAEDFDPMRFGPLDGPHPTEQNTDYKFIPFSGGPRKCVGDQFAVMEAVTALAVLLKRFSVSLTPGQEVGMTTGATIHTTGGLYVNVAERSGGGGKGGGGAPAATAAAAVVA